MQDYAATAAGTAAGEGHSGASGRRRITADSFRMLTARLKKEAYIPDLLPPRSAPSAAAYVPPPAEEPAPPPVAGEPEPAYAPAHDLAARLPVDDFELPEFIPLAPRDDAPVAEAAAAEFAPAAEEVAPVETYFSPAHELHAEPAAGMWQPETELVAEAWAGDWQAEAPVETPVAADAAAEEQLWQEPDWSPQQEPAVVAEPIEALAPVEEPAPLPLQLEDEAQAPEAAPEPLPEVASEAFAAVEEAFDEPLIEEATAPAEEFPAVESAEAVAGEPEPLPPADQIAEDEPAAVQPFEAIEETAEEEPAAPDFAAASDEMALDGDTMPLKAARVASPLADRVVEAMVRTVTEAIYAKPSAAERAAFLREVGESGEAPEAEVMEAAEAPQPLAAPAPPPQAVAPQAEIGEAIAEKLGRPSALLRKTEHSDPFSSPGKGDGGQSRLLDLPEADEDTGELALSLLEMMSGGSATSQPQERALAADTLLRLVPRIPARQLLAIAERVAIMEAPSSLLVARLIRDPRPEIAAPLLERCMQISDNDLLLAATEGDPHKQRMMARRRILSAALSDELIARGDTSVILTLVRNPGATLNHESFYRLAEHAIEHHALLAPLTTRADLPAPVAFELFWHVPQELRRFILSRFLTDSENLNKILKITLATREPGENGVTETRQPPREAVDAALAPCMTGALDSAARRLAEIGGIGAETALRILADREGEPAAVLLKALGYPRSRFAELLEQLQQADAPVLRPGRKLDDLQGIFDTLSFNKARILLTYWDWFMRKAGPYAPHH